MAKAVGGPQTPLRQPPSEVVIPNAVTELVGRLETLARVHEVTRSAVFTALTSGDEPDYASAYEGLFAAVALISPGQAARQLAEWLGEHPIIA